ncbi:hypothetical protein M408DRAFT_331512 [Serendipita vermifera MAFF 305830]|uniref:Nephrocystin 3-like N-terminal domain-containing protein n=1 Tax=Serendipita vermifera MAFF 305830 TaxID=933852 RepID=A0A0C2WEF7_SERVB|nr:hypothetical protein M408DRAFT_331512 [Serendipita vermifera MAFF 305830]
MSTQNSNENSRAIYLHQIGIQIATKTNFRVKVQVGNKDVEIKHEDQTDIWTPVNSLEFPEDSKITVVIKSGHTVGGISIGKREAQAEVSNQEAIQAFWSSTDLISRTVVFDQQPATVTFTFRPSQTAEATRGAVDKLQKEMENYRSLMSSTTEHHIDTALKYGVALAELDPMAKIAFGIAKVAFDVLKEQRKYDEMVSDLAIGVDRILPFANRTLEDVLYDDADVLEDVIRRLHETVVDTATFLCVYAKRSPARRTLKSVINPEDHVKIKGLNDNFTKLKEDFDRAVDVEALKIARKNEIDRLLELLRPVREANYQDDRGCMEGTRTTLLDGIIAWAKGDIIQVTPADSSGANNIYWLYGMPGIGKTSVAHSICQRLHKGGYLGGSFFCRRDDPTLREPKRVLPTLISKLAAMWGPYRTLVAQALRDDPQLNPDSTSGELLLKPLQSLRRHPVHSLVLVIDALDECGDAEARKKLLNSLREASRRVSWLKIIVTSRPEADIQTSFKSSGDPCLEVDDQNDQDIRYFAEQRILSLIQSHSLPDEWPGPIRFDQIIQRAGGLFIYVETIIRLLKASKDPNKSLNRVLNGKQEDASAGLHNLYSTAIALCIGQEAETFRLIARTILAVAKYRPLSDDTLALLIGEESHVVKTWVNDLGSLLYRDETQNGGIRVRHLSIFEFLTESSCPPAFQVNLKQANEELSVYCLRTMTKELRFNICSLETSYLANSEINDLSERVKQRISDALQYSCLHWSDHLCSGPEPAKEDVSVLLDAFFTGEKPLYWLEALSLMGKTHLAASSLRQVKECNEKTLQQTYHLVDEILRFVLAFTTPISTSAPHIYLSGLPFMPHESHLRKNVQRSFPNAIKVSEGRMEKWQSCPAIWHGHTADITAISYSPNGRHIVSGSYDRTIRIWDAETGTTVGEPLTGHSNSVSSVAYSPDGRNIVSGSYDQTIRIWDAETGKAVSGPLSGHSDLVRSVAYSPNVKRIISGSYDQTIRIWDAETGGAVGEPLIGHTSGVTCVAYSPNGRHIVSGSHDETIRIWDAETGKAVGEPLTGHTNWITSVAYSPNGRHIVSASHDETIIWDTETGKAVDEPLTGHTSGVTSVAYSPDGRHIVSGSDDWMIRIWDAETGKAVGEPLSGHSDVVSSVAYSPNGRYIVSGSYDQTIRIWDAETGKAVGEPLTGHAKRVSSVIYSPNGRHIASGSHDGTIRIWDAETGKAVCEPLCGHLGLVSSVAYSPNGRHIVSGSGDMTIRIWDAETGKAMGEPLSGHTYLVSSVAYSPSGRHIASGSYDGTIRIWDTATGKAVGELLTGRTNWITSIAYSPNGRHIASGSADETIRIWDTETGKAMVEPLSGHTDVVSSVAYSPNGIHIVSGSDDRTIRIWNAETGKAVGEPLSGHSDLVRDVTYSPNGRYIVSGSYDQTIRIWDTETGKAVGEPLTGHAKGVSSVAYSPNGRRIISGSHDQTIRIWDAETQKAMDEPLSAHMNLVNSIAYSPNDRHVISGSSEYISRTLGDLNILRKSNLHNSSTISKPLIQSSSVITGFGISKDLVDPNGWVRCVDGILFWVPEDCRNGLTSSALVIIPNAGHHRRVRLDFSDFRYGHSWTDVHGGM